MNLKLAATKCTGKVISPYIAIQELQRSLQDSRQSNHHRVAEDLLIGEAQKAHGKTECHLLQAKGRSQPITVKPIDSSYLVNRNEIYVVNSARLASPIRFVNDRHSIYNQDRVDWPRGGFYCRQPISQLR